MKIMMFAFAPRALITAWRAELVKSVIQVKDTSSAAGRVNLKTLSIINSLFGLAKLDQELPLLGVGFHSTFVRFRMNFEHGFGASWFLLARQEAMFVEILWTRFWKNA
jgi:hypothetical protein